MLKKVIPFIVFFSVSFQYSFSAVPDSKFWGEVKRYYKNMAKLCEPVEGKVYYFTFEETVNYWPDDDGGVENNTDKIDLYITKDKYYLYSKTVNVFQDKQDAFLIMIPQKKIFRTINPNMQGAEKIKGFLYFQEAIMGKSEVLEEKIITLKGIKYAKITIAIPEDVKSELKVNKTTYWYDISAKKIWKTEVEFTENYRIKSKTTQFITMDFDYGKKLNKPVFKKVVNGKNQLVDEYKNFTLIDNRE